MGPLWLGSLLAVIAVAGVGYWIYGQMKTPPAGDGPTPAMERPVERAPAASAPAQPEPSRTAGRTDTILTCTAVDGQVFYTNASRCEDADLDNRVNVLNRPPPPSSRPTNCIGAQEDGRPVQIFLPACQEAFNEALSLEPFLLKLDEPEGSRAARRYCEFITSGVQAGCMATSDQFCFLHLCQAQRESGWALTAGPRRWQASVHDVNPVLADGFTALRDLQRPRPRRLKPGRQARPFRVSVCPKLHIFPIRHSLDCSCRHLETIRHELPTAIRFDDPRRARPQRLE